MKIAELKVLICDDSMLIRKKVHDLLNKMGCDNVWEATDGEEAVSLFQRHEPDVVFMDIIMPKKTGLEALREIRELNREVKIVMASSAGTRSNLQESADAGIFDFVQKPFDDEQILKILSSVLQG